MKIFLAFILTLSICFSSFYGCSQKNENDKYSDDIEKPPQIETIPPIVSDEQPENKTQTEVFLDTEKQITGVLLKFNTEREPFNDLQIRRALAFGIDRAALSEKVEGSKPMYGIIPDDVPYAIARNKTFRNVVGDVYSDNSEYASMILKETSYDIKTANEKKFSITAKEGDGIADEIIIQYFTNIGFLATVNYLDIDSYEKALAEHDYDAILVDYRCAEDSYEYFKELQHSTWKNKTYDSIMEDYKTLTNFETWDKINSFEMLENLIFEEMPYVPLFSLNN